MSNWWICNRIRPTNATFHPWRIKTALDTRRITETGRFTGVFRITEGSQEGAIFIIMRLTHGKPRNTFSKTQAEDLEAVSKFPMRAGGFSEAPSFHQVPRSYISYNASSSLGPSLSYVGNVQYFCAVQFGEFTTIITGGGTSKLSSANTATYDWNTEKISLQSYEMNQARKQHACGVYRSQVIVYGGYGDGWWLPTTEALNFTEADPKWSFVAQEEEIPSHYPVMIQNGEDLFLAPNSYPWSSYIYKFNGTNWKKMYIKALFTVESMVNVPLTYFNNHSCKLESELNATTSRPFNGNNKQIALVTGLAKSHKRNSGLAQLVDFAKGRIYTDCPIPSYNGHKSGTYNYFIKSAFVKDTAIECGSSQFPHGCYILKKQVST